MRKLNIKLVPGDTLLITRLFFFFTVIPPFSEHCTIWVYGLYDPIGQKHQNKSDHRLIQTGSGCHTQIAHTLQGIVNIHIQCLRYAVQAAAVSGNGIEQTEIGTEHTAHSVNQIDTQDELQMGYRDKADLLPLGSSVDGGRFVVIRADADDAGIVDDQHVADALPHVYEKQDEGPVRLGGIPGNALTAEELQHCIDQADVLGQKRVGKIACQKRMK